MDGWLDREMNKKNKEKEGSNVISLNA